MTACTAPGCTCSSDRAHVQTTSTKDAQRHASVWLASPDADRKRTDATGNTDPRRDMQGRRR